MIDGNLVYVVDKQQIQHRRRKLDQDCIRMITKGRAEGTRANRRTHNNAYLRFCDSYYIKPYPATDWQLVQFVQYLFSEESKTPDTVQNYVSSVRVIHRLAGLPVPDANQIHYAMLTDGMKRENKRPVRQAEAVDHQTLKLIFQQVDLKDELQAVTWTAILVGFNLVLRVSNLGPVARNKFDPDKNLIRGDFMIRKGFPSLGIQWAKNNQYKNHINWCPLMPAADRQLCPAWWVSRMLKNIPAHQHEPFFLVREKQSRYPLTSGQIRRLLKQWAIAAALDLRKYTPHCLRRGGLNWAHNARLTGESLKVLGDWVSQEYHKYLDIDFESRIKVGKQMQEYAQNN